MSVRLAFLLVLHTLVNLAAYLPFLGAHFLGLTLFALLNTTIDIAAFIDGVHTILPFIACRPAHFFCAFLACFALLLAW